MSRLVSKIELKLDNPLYLRHIERRNEKIDLT